MNERGYGGEWPAIKERVLARNDLTLADFLLARIAEDEAGNAASHSRGALHTNDCAIHPQGVEDTWCDCGTPARVLAECRAKRRIVNTGGNECGTQWDADSAAEFEAIYGSPPTPHYPTDYAAGCDGCSAAESCDADHRRILSTLAAVYAGHPDYREEWRP